MFDLLYKYVPSGTKGEFSYKVIFAVETNDADLMKKLLLWNSFVGVFSTECAEFLSFAREVITLIINKQHTRLLLTVLEHDPFPQILINRVNLSATNNETENFLLTIFDPSVKQQKIIEILRLFLDRSLNDAQTKNGYTPLWLAVENGMVDVAKFLIDSGANVHVRCVLDNSLIFVVLEDERISIRRQDETQEFVKDMNSELMKLLLSAGIRIDAECCNGVTPLTYIVSNNLSYVLPFLREHVTAVNFKDAVERSILELFLDAIPMISRWDLRPQLYNSKSKAFKMLLSDCSDVNVCNNYGQTALHAIIDHYYDGFSIYRIAIKTNIKIHYIMICEEMAVLLLSKGADIHIKNSEGMTPVHLAAKFKYIKLLRMFHEHRPDYNQRANNGDNMLHSVAKYLTHPDVADTILVRGVIEFLISNGCEINARNNAGLTPLLCGLKMGNIPIVAETLINYGADVNCCDQYGSTPLHAAVKLGYGHVLGMLIERGAELDRKSSKSQMTPLLLAVKLNDLLGFVGILIKAGADARVRLEDGRTALHLAASSNNRSVIRILLEVGVSVNEKDDSGITMLRDVMEYDNFAGFKAMIKYNFDLNKIDARREIFSVPNFETKKVWYKIVKHLLKRKAIDLYVANIYNPYISSLNRELQQYFEECFKEVQPLKCKEAVDQRSFYDLLRMNPKKRFFHTKKKAFKMKIHNYEKLSNEFPVYAPLIFANGIEAASMEERIRLEKSVAKVWYELTKIYLDDICVERIISYVDSCTLELINRVYKNTDSIPKLSLEFSFR